jgi:hypothetical protein
VKSAVDEISPSDTSTFDTESESEMKHHDEHDWAGGRLQADDSVHVSGEKRAIENKLVSIISNLKVFA